MSADPIPSVAESRRSRLAMIARGVQVRLRFLLVLAVAGLVLGGWETLRTYWDRWVLPAAKDPSLGAVSSGTEYFCPMDPGVLSSWPGKCPVCNMELVRRSRSDMTPLPTGVVARVSLSPARVQIGGIAAEPVGFRKLERRVELAGRVEESDGGRVVVVPVDGVGEDWLRPGLAAEVASDPPDGRDPIAGHLESLNGDRAVIRVEKGDSFRPGSRGRATFRHLVSDEEPFRSLPDEPPPLRPGESRNVWTCMEHPDVLRPASGPCPKDGSALMPRTLADDQRLRWWCPMHPKVTADREGAECAECGGMKLVPRVVTYRPKGQVLAVPESSVIDTGSRRVVYVETMPGTFDGVEIVLGPRCGDRYPVASGLEPGQRVATAGAFLIDAETRLNPALAAGYFGASRPSGESSEESKSPMDALPAEDRPLALAQKTCPVTKKALGSMGTPVKVIIGGKAVFVCCEGCVDPLKAKPEKYLAAPHPAHHP